MIVLALRPVTPPFRMLGEPLLDVDGQAVAVRDLAEAVDLSELLEIATAFLEGPLAVLRLLEAEVAVDDLGDGDAGRRQVVFRTAEDLAEFLRSELPVAGVLFTLE